MRRVTQIAVALAVFGSTAAIAWQEQPPMPKPGPEHKVLAMDVGTWDAVVEFSPAPDAPVQKSKGLEVSKMGCGGLCLITDFKSEMMGAPFEGHGVMIWDANKKKYTGIWMDSMSPSIAQTESTYDAKAKRFTSTMTAPDMTGKVTTVRSVSEMPDPNTRVFTMYGPGPGGKEVPTMKITYSRRKR